MMATKCPKCGKDDVLMTNRGKYTAAVAAAIAAAAAVMPFNKIMSRTIMKNTSENMCPYKEYICLNPSCKEMFSIKNNF